MYATKRPRPFARGVGVQLALYVDIKGWRFSLVMYVVEQLVNFDCVTHGLPGIRCVGGCIRRADSVGVHEPSVPHPAGEATCEENIWRAVQNWEVS